MPSPFHPLRQDVDAALRQIEIEEQTRGEVSEREARRMMYRPRPHHIKMNLAAYAFTLIGFALVGLCVLARALGWVK